MDPVNPFLSRLGVLVKRGREQFWDSQDYVVRVGRRRGRPDVAVFFRTRGCRHDLAGGCTMCDYSVGPKTSADQMIAFVRRALLDLPADVGHLLVSPSGSFLDSYEVPRGARLGILSEMGKSGAASLSFESRAETITSAAVEDCREVLPQHHLKVYIGLESADPWVTKYCVNKELAPHAVRSGAALLSSYSIQSCANVIVGTPFLSREDAIQDAVDTVAWAFASGFDECCLFPVHVKRWTQVHWLYEHGHYFPPSLWSFVEVLRRLGSQMVEHRLEIAWITSYGAFNVVASPGTCPRCQNSVIAELTTFADAGDYSCVDRLVEMSCSCKDLWRRELETDVERTRLRRATDAYVAAGEEMVGDAWWASHGPSVLQTMAEDHDLLSAPPAVPSPESEPPRADL